MILLNIKTFLRPSAQKHHHCQSFNLFYCLTILNKNKTLPSIYGIYISQLATCILKISLLAIYFKFTDFIFFSFSDSNNCISILLIDVSIRSIKGMRTTTFHIHFYELIIPIPHTTQVCSLKLKYDKKNDGLVKFLLKQENDTYLILIF